jgi:hypothetical protein
MHTFPSSFAFTIACERGFCNTVWGLIGGGTTPAWGNMVAIWKASLLRESKFHVELDLFDSTLTNPSRLLVKQASKERVGCEHQVQLEWVDLELVCGPWLCAWGPEWLWLCPWSFDIGELAEMRVPYVIPTRTTGPRLKLVSARRIRSKYWTALGWAKRVAIPRRVGVREKVSKRKRRDRFTHALTHHLHLRLASFKRRQWTEMVLILKMQCVRPTRPG